MRIPALIMECAFFDFIFYFRNDSEPHLFSSISHGSESLPVFLILTFSRIIVIIGCISLIRCTWFRCRLRRGRCYGRGRCRWRRCRFRRGRCYGRSRRGRRRWSGRRRRCIIIIIIIVIGVRRCPCRYWCRGNRYILHFLIVCLWCLRYSKAVFTNLICFGIINNNRCSVIDILI